MGDIFGATFRVYSAGFIGIVIIVAMAEIPLSILSFWFGHVLESALEGAFGDFSSFDNFRVGIFVSVFYLGGILVIASLLSFIVVGGALIYGVSGQIIGRPISVVRAYSFSVGRFGAMLGTLILAVLGVLLMAITIVGIPFAIYFGVRWYFILQTASLERCGPLTALGRSSDLVRDNWWRVFGILFVIGILLAIANGIAGTTLGRISYVGPLVISILFTPVWIVAQTLLYHDLRVRRHGPVGYDPDVLARELRGPGAL